MFFCVFTIVYCLLFIVYSLFVVYFVFCILYFVFCILYFVFALSNVSGAWYPSAEQEPDYPGAGEKDGWYWLGFFAGITVECDDVTIDLNGHELKQSPAFYLQQRWFIVIELASKAFLDGQGPTWTGTGITFTRNTVVKNGIIGLSSHIGIHGSNVTDVTLQDLTIRNFETHGIGINEHNGLTIQNVEVGPSVNGHCM